MLLQLARVFKMESAVLIGLTLFPGAITAVVLSIVAGKMVDRIGAKWVALGGTFLMAIAGLVGSLCGNLSIVFIIVIFSLSSSGFVCITTSLPNILTKILSKDQLPTGIGTLQLFQYMGGGIGIAISGNLLTYHHDSLLRFGLVFIFLFVLSLIPIILSLYASPFAAQ
ncbi:MFS transporter [Psychrobacillus sp. NPDC096426]|uniref:MFS transporter n=1 Tax=Psychrobacillus sp. NPDC096426 TaxID=3364491 RepID=UPI00382126B4